MKIRNLLSVLVVGLAVLASKSSATPIKLGESTTLPNSGQATIENWVGGLVTSYNLANDPDLPSPGLELFRVNQGDTPPLGYPSFGSGKLTITIPTGGYDFIALHWGGSGGGVYQAFYIGDFGSDSSYSFVAPGQNGLSWYDVFHVHEGTKVPDGASTALLFVFGAMALAFSRQRFLK